MRLLILSLISFLSFNLIAQSVFINEFHYNDIDTVLEGVEIAGPAGTDLTAWQLVFYDGENFGSVYRTENLNGVIPNQENGYGTIAITFNSDVIQDGNDGIALLNDNNDLIQFISYGGPPNILAEGGPAAGQSSTDIGVSQPNPTTRSLQLCGVGTEYSDFMWVDDIDTSFGAVNSCQMFPIVLPVLLKSIRLERKNKTHKLSWETSSEMNTDHFVVQHSIDAESWLDLNRITAANQGHLDQYYSVVNAFPSRGNNYYRIKMVDIDGSYTYSPIVEDWYVDVTNRPEAMLINGSLQVFGNRIQHVSVYNVLGAVLFNQSFDNVDSIRQPFINYPSNTIGIVQIWDSGVKFQYALHLN